jgi:peptide-methionine (S)-S-oxide reductase
MTAAYTPVDLGAFDIDVAAPPPSETATATFGMGCFWGPDAKFGALPGVVRTRVGYAGGTHSDPSYYSLGDHTEVLQVEYDPTEIEYTDLLEVFWANHDPFSTAHKRQYRGLLLVHDDTQRDAAEQSQEALIERTGKAVQTPIESLTEFTPAEAYHQKYELRSTPVVGDELLDIYDDALVDSTVAARLNGLAAGHHDNPEELLASLALSPAACSELRRRL